jgi:hypothetical protein
LYSCWANRKQTGSHPTINRKILKLGDKKGDKMVDKQHRTYKNPERVIIG